MDRVLPGRYGDDRVHDAVHAAISGGNPDPGTLNTPCGVRFVTLGPQEVHKLYVASSNCKCEADQPRGAPITD
jgi:hypothetical protein